MKLSLMLLVVDFSTWTRLGFTAGVDVHINLPSRILRVGPEAATCCDAMPHLLPFVVAEVFGITILQVDLYDRKYPNDCYVYRYSKWVSLEYSRKVADAREEVAILWYDNVAMVYCQQATAITKVLRFLDAADVALMQVVAYLARCKSPCLSKSRADIFQAINIIGVQTLYAVRLWKLELSATETDTTFVKVYLCLLLFNETKTLMQTQDQLPKGATISFYLGKVDGIPPTIHNLRAFLSSKLLAIRPSPKYNRAD
ncbi:hypothetical protein EV421DRAFT_1735369 [Armillaria borealis]|uniref:Uncharacterized protein n=1 Tax=Armillaria borealis TaxID=47425 RepID=A0AA39JLE9_9AGAR|nr:hypothetical protein EV421DRAFT_1735369 [Armillaria borealis]